MSELDDLEARLTAMVTAVPASPNKIAIRRELLTVQPVVSRFRRRGWWIAIAAAASLAFSGVAVASRKALPGDVLYPLKRAFSAVNVATSFNQSSHASALLDRAQADLGEAKALAADHKTKREIEALDVFAGDLSNARSVIAKVTGADQGRLGNRADDLERQASDLRASVQLIPQGHSTITPDEEHNGQSEGPFVQQSNSDNNKSNEQTAQPNPKESDQNKQDQQSPSKKGNGASDGGDGSSHASRGKGSSNSGNGSGGDHGGDGSGGSGGGGGE